MLGLKFWKETVISPVFHVPGCKFLAHNNYNILFILFLFFLIRNEYPANQEKGRKRIKELRFPDVQLWSITSSRKDSFKQHEERYWRGIATMDSIRKS